MLGFSSIYCQQWIVVLIIQVRLNCIPFDFMHVYVYYFIDRCACKRIVSLQ